MRLFGRVVWALAFVVLIGSLAGACKEGDEGKLQSLVGTWNSKEFVIDVNGEPVTLYADVPEATPFHGQEVEGGEGTLELEQGGDFRLDFAASIGGTDYGPSLEGTYEVEADESGDTGTLTLTTSFAERKVVYAYEVTETNLLLTRGEVAEELLRSAYPPSSAELERAGR